MSRVGWHSSSRELARHAQERAGWSDEQLLARLMSVLDGPGTPDVTAAREPVAARLAALPADATVTQRIALVADGLPAFSGPWGSYPLDQLLAGASAPPPYRG